MMNRRAFLAAGTSGIAIGLAGCSEVQSIVGGGTKPLGESVKHRNLRVTPEGYESAQTIIFDITDANNMMDMTAPQGATYLLTRLHVEHLGDAERVFPARGNLSLHNNWVEVFYNAESTDYPEEETYSTAIETNSQRLPCYHHVVDQGGYDSGVYEGAAVGWLVNEIPQGFNPGDTTIEITWGADSYVGVDEPNIKTFTWTYSSE